MPDERSEIWNLMLSVLLVAVGVAVGYLYAVNSKPGIADNAAIAVRLTDSGCEIKLTEAAKRVKILEAGMNQAKLDRLEAMRVFHNFQEKLEEIAEEKARYATVLMEEDSNDGQLILGGLALLLGMPTGVANIAQGLQGAQARWVLPGRLQPRSPKAKAMYLYLDTKTGAREGPFTAPVLSAGSERPQ